MNLNANNIVETMFRYVADCISPYRSFLLAFSGGLDSTVLLDILANLRNIDGFLKGSDVPTFRAVHVHHALSRHADKWVKHSEKECFRRCVPFTMVRIVIDTIPENGIEAAARDARYRALVTELIKDEVLLTAHHQDDQAETLLLALKRGSGPAGLASMAVNKLYLGHRLIRPLLNFNRRELEFYAQVRGLRWIEDDGNTDLRFDRNFLRLSILPSLRQRWPKFANAVARSAQLCAKQEQLLDELLKETLADIIALDGSLRLTELITMSESKRSALLRRWLTSLGVKMPAQAQLVRLWQEVALSRRDAVAQMKFDKWQVRRFRNHLYVLPQSRLLIDKKAIFFWQREDKCLALPSGLGYLYRRLIVAGSVVLAKPPVVMVKEKYLGLEELQNIGVIHDSDVEHNINNNSNISDVVNTSFTGRNITETATPLAIVRAPLPDEVVSIRFGSAHGLLHIVGRRRGRSLKKIWQELDIPPWRRSSTPLVFYNDQLITALGVFITWEGVVREHQAQWQLFWQLDNISKMLPALESKN